MSEPMLYAKDGAIATLRFNRPEKKNAISLAMYRAMIDGLNDAAADENVRAVALLGGDAFTAGNDIGDFLAGGAQVTDIVAFLHGIRDFPKPIIAGVRGPAVGIGTTILMHCDGVVAGDSARFSLPFTRLGLVPEAGSSLLFPLIAGRSRATWHLLSGEPFGAAEAVAMGLATRSAEDGEVDAIALAMCAAVAELPPKSVAATKRLIKAPFDEVLSNVMDAEIAAFGAALASDEARAAFMKFMQR